LLAFAVCPISAVLRMRAGSKCQQGPARIATQLSIRPQGLPGTRTASR
jgi:hypothetical protein